MGELNFVHNSTLFVLHSSLTHTRTLLLSSLFLQSIQFADEFGLIPSVCSREEWEEHFLIACQGARHLAELRTRGLSSAEDELPGDEVLGFRSFVDLLARVALCAHPAGQEFNALWRKDPLSRCVFFVCVLMCVRCRGKECVTFSFGVAAYSSSS